MSMWVRLGGLLVLLFGIGWGFVWYTFSEYPAMRIQSITVLSILLGSYMLIFSRLYKQTRPYR